MTRSKMNKRRVIKINLSNKLFYSLIAVFAVLILGIGVYAYGTSNPSVMGHSMNEVQPPTQCNGYLKYDSSNGWTCEDVSVSDYTPDITCDDNDEGLQWTGSSWSCGTYSTDVGDCVQVPCSWSGWQGSCPGGYSEVSHLKYCDSGVSYLSYEMQCTSGYVSDVESLVCCRDSYSF